VDPHELVAGLGDVNLCADVSEDAVAYSLAHVERFAVTWIDEPIDVSLQFVDDLWRKCLHAGRTSLETGNENMSGTV